MSEATVVQSRRRVAPFIMIPIGVVMLAFVVLLATGDPSKDGLAKTPLLSKAAPPIEGATLSMTSPTMRGEPISLASLRGKWVVVNFFASWCVPCIQEHPDLISFQEAHRAKGDATVLSVVFADSITAVKKFFAERGGDWPVVVENTTQFAVSYGVVAAPETYLVAPNGIIVAKFLGGVTHEKLDSVITKFGGGK